MNEGITLAGLEEEVRRSTAAAMDKWVQQQMGPVMQAETIAARIRKQINEQRIKNPALFDPEKAKIVLGTNSWDRMCVEQSIPNPDPSRIPGSPGTIFGIPVEVSRVVDPNAVYIIDTTNSTAVAVSAVKKIVRYITLKHDEECFVHPGVEPPYIVQVYDSSTGMVLDGWNISVRCEVISGDCFITWHCTDASETDDPVLDARVVFIG